MRINLINRAFSALILFLFIYAINGCDSGQSSGDMGTQIASLAEQAGDSHEGHNHAPGEHGKAAVSESGATDELDWCDEHFVPESQCTKCDSRLTIDFKKSGDWCAGHDLPESHCRSCNPELRFPQEEILLNRRLDLSGDDIEVSLFFRPNASVCATDGALIQFASAETVERAGISIQTLREAKMENVIEAPAEVVFDETESTVITTTVSALVSRWLVSPGDIVHRGDILAILQSPEIAQLKSSLVSDYSNYEVQRKELERHQEMKNRNLISEAEFDRQFAITERARAELVSIKGLLTAAGLDEGDIKDIIDNGSISSRYALRAQSEGMVIDRIAQLGQFHNAGEAFAMLADPESIWIEAQLTEARLRTVETGQQLTFFSDGRSLNGVGGEIIWISRFLDPHTRTGTVRARVLDRNHNLHAGEFGRVKIIQSEINDIALVPKDAVQWEGCCNVVFIKEAQDRFRPRKVGLLDGEGSFYQVSEGVLPGEQVVVDGAFLLKTELKKTSIGAGCCGLDPVG